MYPRSSATPPRIAVGSIYLIADGTKQTADALATVTPQGGNETAAGGTLACLGTSGVWVYTPTQAETNYEAFVVTVYKADCTTASVTIVTTAESVAGKVSLGSAQTTNITGNLSGSVGSVTGAVGSVTGAVGSVAADVSANVTKWKGSTAPDAPPSNAQLEARTLEATDYATSSALSVVANYIDTEIAAIYQDTHTTLPGLINAIDVNVTISPISSTVSAGQVTDGTITLYQNQAIYNVTIGIEDGDGNPINCSGLGLAFCVYLRGAPTTILWSLTSAAGELTAGGTGNATITLSDDDTHTGTSGIYRYVLWDTTNDRVLARGELVIEEEADSA